MDVIGEVLYLRPGCYDEYKRRHDELWPEMHEAMTKAHIDMAIFRDDDRLYVVGAVPDSDAWQTVSENAVVAKWNEYMKEVLQTDEQNRLIRKPLQPAFLFGRFTK